MIVCAVASTLSLGSCTDELHYPSPDSDLRTESIRLKHGGPFLFSLTLDQVDGVPATRDGETTRSNNGFVEGTGDENTINNMLILFFKEDGTQIFYYDTDEDYDKDDEITTTTDTEEEDVEVTFKKTLTFSVGFGLGDEGEDEEIEAFEERLKTVKHYVVILNHNPSIKASVVGKKLSDLMTTPVVDTDNQGALTMSTAGYYDNTRKYIYYNSKKSDKESLFYKSKSLAESNREKVYVERLNARVDFTISKSVIQPVKVVHGTYIYNLNFEPEFLELQATEGGEYISKNMPDGSIYIDESFYNWMNYENRRTFWAQSPWFRGGTYPASGSEGNSISPSLSYVTNSQITSGDLMTPIVSMEDITWMKSMYTLEHTFNDTELSKNGVENPYAVPTSIVLMGKYTQKYIKDDDNRNNDILDQDTSTEDQDTSTEDPDTSTEDPAHKPTDETVEDPAPAPKLTDEQLSRGFYIRLIDMERTDHNTYPTPENYKYRLYLKDDREYSQYNANTYVESSHNELYKAMVKEQYAIFLKIYYKYGEMTEEEKELTEKDEETDEVTGEEVTTYTPLKLDKPDEDKGYKTSDFLGITNTNRIWLQNDWIAAPNTYTLQMKLSLSDLNSKLENVKGKIQEMVEDRLSKLNKEFKILDVKVKLCYARVSDYKDSGDENHGNNPHQDYTEINNANDIVMANYALQKQLGYATYYDQGRGFFYSPIPHYMIPSSYNGKLSFDKEVIEDEEGNPEYTKYTPNNTTADFGIVRNHIYHIKVNSISDLAYGKTPGEKDIPLPTMRFDNVQYLFDINIQILPWHKFDYTIDIEK